MILFYYLFNIFLISGIGYNLWQQEKNLFLKQFFIPALILKLTAGIILGIFYSYYFGGGDAQLFQNQSDYVTEFARISPASYLRLLLTRNFESETLRTSMIYVWYSNSYFMVMLLSALNFLTGGNLYLNSLYFSLFSFWGLWQLVKVLVRFHPQYTLPAIISFLFFPSVVFWTSGISKEAVYLGSLGWLIAAVLRLINHNSGRVWPDVLSLLVAGYLLWKIKFYFAALVFALLISYGLVNYLTTKVKLLISTRYKLILFGIILITGSFIISKWNAVLKLDYFISQLIQSNSVLAESSTGKPMIVYSGLEPNLGSFIKNSPAAVFHTFMRPFIWEGKTFFYRLAGLENLIIALLLVYTLFEIIRKFPTRFNLGVLVIIIYVVVIAALIGLSTPNIGSLNRYRTAVLPFLIFLLLSFNNQKFFSGWLKD